MFMTRKEQLEQARAWKNDWPVGSKGLLKIYGEERLVQVKQSQLERGWPLLYLIDDYGSDHWLPYSARKRLSKKIEGTE